MIATTRKGETLDALCYRIYGTAYTGYVEGILGQNPGLAALGVKLPHGTQITMPDPPTNQGSSTNTATASTINLWD